MLTSLFSDGKVTSGLGGPLREDNFDFKTWVTRVLWSQAFSAMWSAPSSGVFVLDSGFSCDQRSSDPLTPERMDARTANMTSACYDEKLYYLVRTADGSARHCRPTECGIGGCMPAWYCAGNKFVAPNGLESVIDDRWEYGYVSVNDLVAG